MALSCVTEGVVQDGIKFKRLFAFLYSQKQVQNFTNAMNFQNLISLFGV
jgi:hypothetical protein